MSTLGALLAEHTVLPGRAVDHLHALVSEWQLLADLSFADYLMWVRRDDGALTCVAQCRPNTAPTAMPGDAVGTVRSAEQMPTMTAAFDSGVAARHTDGGHDTEIVPVRCDGQVVAMVTYQHALPAGRKLSRLEAAYLGCAQILVQMMAEGTFPEAGAATMPHSGPRVGDGFIWLNGDGVIVYASPNAVSVYRRIGFAPKLIGHDLIAITRPRIPDSFEAGDVADHIRTALSGAGGMQFEIAAAGAVILMRTLSLVVGGAPTGAAVLVRDITEVKSRDRALLSKDAIIREIHHRVKNNLQTVAALLRLQARRTSSVDGRQALNEALRRVSSIALVHDALSMSVNEEVDLDALVDRILPMMNDVASVDTPIRIDRVGTLGVFDADRAMALTMVIAELVHNAIEHAFNPTASERRVTIRAERSARWLDVVVHDDGHGLPEGFSLENTGRLGLQIVGTLISAELDGSLATRSAPGGGTDMVMHIPLGRRRTRATP